MTERISTASGRLTGWLMLGLAAFVLVLAVLEEAALTPLGPAAVLVGVLAWASTLRPALVVDDGVLVLRNMLDTVRVPLAAIEQLAVRQVLVLRCGDKRYVSSAVGRSWRQAMKSSRPGDSDKSRLRASMSEADLVEERLHRLMEDARASAGVTSYSDEQLALAEDVRREPAWLPIVLVGLALAALVATLVL
ncbi:MAG TPA: hypothetical protein VF728_05910 [Nocardioides sp.]